jgi:beta-lactamase superfamily II metal-dependent hydrolase
MRLRFLLSLLGALIVCASMTAAAWPALALGEGGGPLQIYFIDVEGGQSTLIVTSDRRAVLIDAGWSQANHRDADRIQAAARDAQITALDYLILTHFHEDHAGGVAEIARRLPVKTFVDYGAPIEQGTFTQAPFMTYSGARAQGQQLHPKPGERLSLGDVEIEVVSAGGEVTKRPLQGVTSKLTSGCAPVTRGAADEGENPRSLGVRLRFGRFSFLDLGDLSGANLVALVCPDNLLGHSDVYLVPHHGNADTAIVPLITAVSPRIAILNNGVTKGGDPSAMAALKAAGVGEVWQLHRSVAAGSSNAPDNFIANVTDTPDAAAWLKVTADSDGSFSVTNGRTGETKAYR